MRTQSVRVIVAAVLFFALVVGNSFAQQIPDPPSAGAGRDGQSTVQNGDTIQSVRIDTSAPSENPSGELRSQESDRPLNGDLASVKGQQPQPNEVRYELLLQYAKANLELSEVELQQMLQIVRRSPGAVPRMTIERLESNVAVAREQYDEAVLASADRVERVRLQHAKERLRLATVELKDVQRAADEGVIDELELKRVSLRYEMARLNLVIAKNPESFLTLLPYLESKVNRLSDEILELDKRLSKLEPTAIRYRQ